MPQAATLNSVLGPITPDQLGFTLMHEHVLVAASGLYQSYPDLLGVGPEARAIASLKRAKAAGLDSILDATTFDLGRPAPLPLGVSAASGVSAGRKPTKTATRPPWRGWISASPPAAPGRYWVAMARANPPLLPCCSAFWCQVPGA